MLSWEEIIFLPEFRQTDQISLPASPGDFTYTSFRSVVSELFIGNPLLSSSLPKEEKAFCSLGSNSLIWICRPNIFEPDRKSSNKKQKLKQKLKLKQPN